MHGQGDSQNGGVRSMRSSAGNGGQCGVLVEGGGDLRWFQSSRRARVVCELT